MCAPALTVIETREIGTSYATLARVAPDGHRLVGVEVDVSGAASIRVLSPLGAELWTATASGASKVGVVLDAAFPSYQLEVKSTSGSIFVTAALHAR